MCDLPFRLVGERLFGGVTHSVRLDVGFVDEVDSVFVAQLVPLRVVGIMRSAHGVDIVALHKFEILNHPPDRHSAPVVGIVFVAINAFDENRDPVHEQLPALDFHLAKAEPALLDFDGLAG